jgi:hypothetical protein
MIQACAGSPCTVFLDGEPAVRTSCVSAEVRLPRHFFLMHARVSPSNPSHNRIGADSARHKTVCRLSAVNVYIKCNTFLQREQIYAYLHGISPTPIMSPSRASRVVGCSLRKAAGGTQTRFLLEENAYEGNISYTINLAIVGQGEASFPFLASQPLDSASSAIVPSTLDSNAG